METVDDLIASDLNHEASLISDIKSDGANDNDNANETFDEREMRRHFMDIESSFLPDVRPEVTSAKEGNGLDDTYLELGRPGHTPPPEEAIASLSSGGRQRALSEHLHPVESNGSMEVLTESRSAGEEADESHTFGDSNVSYPTAASNNSRPGTPGNQRPTSKGSTIRPGSSPMAQTTTPKHSESEPSQSVASTPSRFASRRAQLRTRQMSQSSISSAAESDLSGSDAVAADYALQTGGSASIHNSFLAGSHRSPLLSRLPSYGSIGSFTDRDDAAVPPLSRGISNSSLLASIRAGGGRLDMMNEERPETPRGTASNLVDIPTDTVIAQHVQVSKVGRVVSFIRSHSGEHTMCTMLS